MSVDGTEPARHKRRGAVGLPGWWHWAAALFVVTATLAALLSAQGLRVESDVSKTISGESAAYRAYTALEAEYSAPSQDEVIVVRTTDLGDPTSFAAFEDLLFDLQLTEGVGAVLSLFSIPDPDGSALPMMRREDFLRQPVADRLDRLRAASALGARIVSANRSLTILIAVPDLSVDEETRLSNIDAVLQQADPRLDTALLGVAALNREISRALVADQLFIIPAAFLACLICAFLLFRSARAALICGVPPLVALVWSAGALAASGVPFSPLMSAVPVLILVLGIADGVHVFHAVNTQFARHGRYAAIAIGLRQMLPALAVTSGTTALAFLGLLYANTPALDRLALAGTVGLLLSLLAILTVLPLAVRYLGPAEPVAVDRAWTGRLCSLALRALKRPRLARTVGLALLALLVLPQPWATRGISVMEYVPLGSEFRANLTALEDELPGSNQIFVVIDALDDVAAVSEAEAEMLRRATAAIYGETEFGDIASSARDVPPALRARFSGQTGRAFALPVFAPLSNDSRQTRALSDRTEAALDAAGLAGRFHITGYTYMISVEVPKLTSDLRVAFYLAVALVTVCAVALTRSWRVALAAMVPNLIPILAVEAALVLLALPLSLSGAVALTIAFGIAVDDTVHILNRVRLAGMHRGDDPSDVLRRALGKSVAPIATTTVILLAGFALTALSTLPTIADFGVMAASVVAVALMADLFLFPSLLRWALARRRGR